MRKETKAQIAKVLKKSKTKLLKKSHVVGVGIGEKITGGRPTGRMSLKVYVERKIARRKLSKSDRVPQTISEVETDVEEKIRDSSV